ncbi:PIG-L deacetylase family protein [Micromonospora sp. NPDC049060]|uniref:PIG-L deacetylase family protein n=1 Tax=Micromonospora sp. NPDC049060 TaxID=3154828 RepID=UPI00340E70D6
MVLPEQEVAMTEPTGPRPLEPVTEQWQRALAIVAHPDDLEFGAAAAVARWTAQGKQIVYCLVTSGEAGIDAMPPPRAREVREREQRESAALVGVETVEFLGLPDGVLEYGVPLRRALAGAVRRHRPEIVITNNFRDTWDGAYALNQADHIATGRAVLDAVRDAGNRWVFPEQLADGIEPWNGVRQVWAASSPLAAHGVDVTDTFARGVASLRAHDAYLSGLGDGSFDPEEFLEGLCRPVGTRLGVRHGTAFEVFHFDLW